jgi:hypothetical protein
MWFSRTPQKILAQPDAKAVVRELVARIGSDRGFAQLSHAERCLLLVYRLRAETLNGTLEQYLANSSGDAFTETVAALSEIGAKDAQSVLEEVAAWFPDSIPPKDRATRGGLIEKMREPSPEAFEKRVRAATDRITAAFGQTLNDLVKYLREHVADIK